MNTIRIHEAHASWQTEKTTRHEELGLDGSKQLRETREREFRDQHVSAWEAFNHVEDRIRDGSSGRGFQENPGWSGEECRELLEECHTPARQLQELSGTSPESENNGGHHG